MLAIKVKCIKDSSTEMERSVLFLDKENKNVVGRIELSANGGNPKELSVEYFGFKNSLVTKEQYHSFEKRYEHKFNILDIASLGHPTKVIVFANKETGEYIGKILFGKASGKLNSQLYIGDFKELKIFRGKSYQKHLESGTL